MKFFGKRVATAVESRQEVLLRSAESDIAICRSAISTNLERANFEYAARSADSALRDYLERVVILGRAQNNYPRAREELTAALPFVQALEDAVTRCNERGFSADGKNFIHLINFTSAFLLLMLRQGWLLAEKMVMLSALPVVKEEGLGENSGGVLDVIVRMLVATIDGDHAAFAAAQRRFNVERSVDRYYEVYFEYDRMMASIMAGDAKGVADFLGALEVQFLQRATDKLLVSQELLKAAGDDNALVFDVWAVALAQLARHRGIVLTYSSPVLPIGEFA